MIDVRQHFVEQAAHCAEVGSPFTAAVLRAAWDQLDRNTALGRRVLDWGGDPRADALALRVAGGLHALALSGDAPALSAAYPGGAYGGDEAHLAGAIKQGLRDHGPALEDTLDSPPQTSEVARSAVLAAGFLAVGALTERPLALLEIGASAGLNLLWDQYRYDLGGVPWGDATAKLRLSPTWQGPPPPLGPVRVVGRAGCDHNPIDLRSAAGRRRVRSYIWPDQAARMARLEAAIEVVAQSDLVLSKADAVDWLTARLAERPENAATVLFHSVVWQYLSTDSKTQLRELLEQAGQASDTAAPLAWLRMERDTAAAATELRLTLWPGGADRLLARADFHGGWIDWYGTACA